MYNMEKDLQRLFSIVTVATTIAISASASVLGNAAPFPSPTPPLPPPVNVKVTNTSAEAVPVTGTINVGSIGSGTLDVRIVNSSTEPAPIIGNVTVNNSAGPLLVRDADNPARQPFDFSSTLFFSDGQFVSTSFQVPAGKRLVIERVSTQGALVTSAANKKLTVQVSTSAFSCCSFIESWFSATNAGQIVVPAGARDWFVGTWQTKIYVREGGDVNLRLIRNMVEVGGSEWGSVNVSGYLIDLP